MNGSQVFVLAMMFTRFVVFAPEVDVLGDAEPREGSCARAETLGDGVDLLLEVGAEMLRDVVDEEVDVPREEVVGVDDGVDVCGLDVVADGHGEVVDEGRRDGGRLHDGGPVEADLLVHGDGELHGHVEVAEEPGEEGRGGDEGLVGHEGACAWFGFVCLGLVGPVLHVLLVHPLVHLLVEGVVAEGEVGVEVAALAGCVARVVLLEVELERGDGAER